jgi:hypothetical protein
MCAGSLEEGRRLENLSWRVWNIETFCCDPISEANATTPAISISQRSSEGRYTADVPDLSSSLDSLADEHVVEFDSESSSTSAPLEISRPQAGRQSRGRERHITPDDLEKMVITIKEKKDLKPLDLSISSLAPPPEKTSEPRSPQESTSQPKIPTIKIIASKHSSSLTQPASPLPTAPSSTPTADITATKSTKTPTMKKTGMFAPGGSSGGDSLSSMENKVQPPKKNPIFTFGGSSNEDESSLPQKVQPQRQPPSALTKSIQGPTKKQTSFKEEVATRTIMEEQPFDDDVFETDDEDGIDESAIDDDDDDSTEWEDSNEDSGNASIDEKELFKRVDSRPNLTSRRSLITTMLHQNDRANALATAASKSTPALHRSSRTTSPNGPSLAASPDSDEGGPLMMKGLKPISEIPRSVAQPIIKTTTNTTPHQLALSPKTTRRNMLANELTVSLRHQLLWERQQKTQTANAVLKRRHTAHDVANLKQYPENVHINLDDTETNASWNQYFNSGLGEYHSKGW